MGGPKLYNDNVVNVWAGRSDGTPPFLLIRGVPSIEEATVLTNGGKTVPVTLSPEIEEFGLRFGAAALPEDDPPEILTVRLGDGRVIQGKVHFARRSPTRWPPVTRTQRPSVSCWRPTTSGWSPSVAS